MHWYPPDRLPQCKCDRQIDRQTDNEMLLSNDDSYTTSLKVPNTYYRIVHITTILEEINEIDK